MSSQIFGLLGLVASIFVTVSSIADDGDRAIAAIVNEFVKPGEPGCTVGVAQDGTLTHALAFGMADIGSNRPLDTHSVFDLASVSKQFTAFSILLLEQQGKLKLDDPVLKFLPELAASAQGVTLRHLMHHTGGLRDYISLLNMKGRGTADGATTHETVQLLARQTKPNEAPGVEYAYSNTGYFLLGLVVAKVSGESLADFERKQIFEPLGMKETRIVDRFPAGIAARARGYDKSDLGFVIAESGWEQVGDGGVFSNLHDLALWDEYSYTGKVGGHALAERMYEVGVLNSGKPIGYAAGLSVFESGGLRWVAHGGSWAGYRSRLLRAPDEHFSVIVLCNRGDADAYALADSIAQAFLKDKLGPPGPGEDDEEEAAPVPAAWEPKDLSRYAGVYYSEEADARCVLDERGGRLVLETCATGELLSPGKVGEFVTLGGASLRFPFGGGDADSFVYDSPDVRGLPFKRIKESFE